MVKTDRIRTEMMQICSRIELSQFSSPKMFRHLFATTLQEANIDPLVRSELMGHSTGQQTLGTTCKLNMREALNCVRRRNSLVRSATGHSVHDG